MRIELYWEVFFQGPMRKNVNVFSILTLVAIFIILVAQIVVLSTDYWSETEVRNSTTTVSVFTLNFEQSQNSYANIYHFKGMTLCAFRITSYL